MKTENAPHAGAVLSGGGQDARAGGIEGVPAGGATGCKKRVVMQSFAAAGRPRADAVGKRRAEAEPFAKMACGNARFPAGGVSQKCAARQRTGNVSRAQGSGSGHMGAGIFHGLRIAGFAQQGNEALQPGGKALAPGCKTGKV